MPRRPIIHSLERRRLLAAVSVADLSISDIPELPPWPSATGLSDIFTSTLPSPTAGVAVGDTFYFARGSDGRAPNGSDLWTSDGTPAGTRTVGRVNNFGHVSNVFPFNGSVYSAETDAGSPRPVQLWKSNPATGVSEPLPIPTGTVHPNPPDLDYTPFNGALYYVSDTLWKIDPAQPTPINVRSTGIRNARSLTQVGNSMVFLTETGLWKSDGTPAGTVQAVPLTTDAYNFASPIVRLGDGLLFSRRGRLHRTDLAATTLQTLHSTAHSRGGASLVGMPELVVAGGRAFFSARGPAVGDNIGDELFVTDGTAAGTRLVKDIRPGSLSSNPRHLTVVGDRVYFVSYHDNGNHSGGHGLELWTSDGTEAGTTLVSDLVPGAAGSNPSHLTAFGGRLYFTADSPGVGRELFVTDGTPAGTRPVADLFPGPAGSLPQFVIAGETKLLFTALHPAHGYSAFVIEGDGAAGPTFVADLLPGALNERVPIAGTVNGDVFYADGDAMPTGREPHVTGPAGGGRLLLDANPGPAGSDPASFATLGEQVLFRAVHSDWGTEAWRADAGGAEMLGDRTSPRAENQTVSIQGPFFGRAFINYTYTDTFGTPILIREAYASQGTMETTFKVGNFNFGPLVQLGDFLYGINDTGGTSVSLTRYNPDGTGAQTVKSVPANPPLTRTTAPARNLTAVGDVLYFTAVDRFTGGELWKSDGTAAGTVMVKDLVPGTTHSMPGQFTPLRGNTAVFTASPDYSFQGGDHELWVTDGTAAGTVLLDAIRPGPGAPFPKDLVHFNGLAYFSADDGANGRELWRTDGTAAGTVRVKDIAEGAAGSAPAELRVVGGRLYFTAADPEGGRELWATDGTADGTVRVQDINPGRGSSDPMNLTDVSGDLYFTANDGASPKLYRLGSPAPQVVGRHVFYNNSVFDGRTPGAGPADDSAVAPDKSALLPGQAATFANVTSYAKGLNGVMIDLAGRPGRPLRPEDFEVRLSRGGNAAQWTAGPAPSSVTVRRLPGPGGVDRVTLVWPDGAIRNTWAQVTVKANWNTALAAAEVFTFGNLVGDTGPAAAAPPGVFSVNGADYLATRARQRTRISLSSAYDFNRDGVVNVLDLALTRRAARTALGAPPADPVTSVLSPQRTRASYGPPAPRPAPVAAAASVSVQASVISGTVFHDADVDGTLDAGEAGVSGRRVWLDADNDRVFDAAETNVTSGTDGRYAFAGLAAGTYNVRSVVPNGWNATSPAARVVTVADGQNATGVTFGAIPATSVGTIYGFPFDDVNVNGVRDTGERYLVPGRVVYLDDDNDGVLDDGERSRTTQVDGFFFNNLLPGTYVVRLVTPEGMRQTVPAFGAPIVVQLAAGQPFNAEFGVAPLPNRVDLPAAADAYVRSNAAFATTNFGESPDLVVRNPGVTFDGSRETYLRFDLTNVATFSTAKLRLYGAASAAGETLPVALFPVADVEWGETTINWSNKPSPSGLSPLVTTSVAGTAARWYEWNVGDYVRQRKAAGATAVSFVLRATQARTIDATFRSAESSDSSLRPRLALDAGPLVNDVIVSSSKWTTRFLTHLRTAGQTPVNSDLGYGLPSNTTSLVRLPWVNLDRIRIRFNEDAIVRREDLQVGGVNGRTYPVAGFSYNPQTFVATWTLAQSLDSDRVSVSLSGAVTDRGSTPLAGGYFRGFNVEPGDATRDLRVNGTDILQIRARHGRTTLRPGTGTSAYSIFHDLNGDGAINVLDLAAARRFV